MVITRTPYRLSFFGGGTDYRPWFENHKSMIIASAMSHYCYISARHLPPFFEHKTRAVYSKIESVKSNDEISHLSIKHCLEYMKISEGLEIHHDGDLPARSGIGSSSSFTVGFLHALHALRFQMATKQELADGAIKVEQELVRETVGIQDQIMAAYGGMQIIEMGPGPHYTVTPFILPPDYLKHLEDHVLLAFTGLSRTASDIAKAKTQNIIEGTSKKSLEDISALANEALVLFRNRADMDKIGELLDHSWTAKKQMASSVSSSDIDDLYLTARKAGAYGGKLLGAGGGGFIMFLAPPEKHQRIKEALPQLPVWVPFQIDKGGSQVIFHSNLPRHSS